jgi:tetratricopeptide (TPR) repeat protein
MSANGARAIFVELVAQVPPEQWEARLAVLAGGDAALRDRVALLLAAHRKADSFLEHPAAPLGDTADDSGAAAAPLDPQGAGGAPTETAGVVLAGRYKLLEVLGEGGMGAVWMAQQTEPVKRLVAVKLIKAGMDSKQVLGRFEAERQALALMDHPNIARVFDAGVTAEGRPYFVMELVRGVPITRYCDEHHLTPRQRLELFIPVCQAIQHAHQKGIIHRDVKPSNVLVALYDGKPVPKVIDFGIAKASGQQLTEHTLVTGFGTVVGTPEYMSPEQAEVNQLDIDTRSDVYSLGVLLYELLAGSPPFSRKELEKGGLLEMLRVIREQEPTKPSAKLSTAEGLPTLAANRGTEPVKLTRLVRGELDWIVMKALEKDRTRRYDTANAFAADVQRYLSDEPVQAGPPSATYRLRKFVRRHRVPVLAGLLLLLALVLGMAGTTVGLVQAEQAQQEEVEQRRQAERERDQKEKARALAEKAAAAEKLAKEAVQKHLKQVLKNNVILASIFRDLNPHREENQGVSLQAQLAARLVKAAELLEGEAVGDAQTVSAMQLILGQTLTSLGHAGQAIPVLTRSLQTFDKLPGTKPSDRFLIMNDLAAAYKEAGKLQPAVKLFRETFEQRKAVLGAAHDDTLTTMNNLGDAYREAGNLDLALQLAVEALALMKKTKGEGDARTLTCMNNLATVYMEAGKINQALALYRETLEKTKAKPGDHVSTLTSMSNLGHAYLAAGQLEEALPLCVDTLARWKAKLGPNHPGTLTSMANLADAYREAGKLDSALALHLECLERRKVRLGADHPGTLHSMNNLALLYLDLEKADLALSLLRESLERARTALGPDHKDTLKVMSNLALGYRRTGNLDLAVQVFRDELELVKARLGEDHPLTLTTMNCLAETYTVSGRLALAWPLFVTTLEKRKVTLGPDHPDTLISMNNLAGVYHAMGRFDRAVPLYEEALAKMKAVRPDHHETLTCMNNLGDAYRATRKYDRAEPLLKSALEKRKARQGPDHPDTLVVMNTLGLTYHDWGKLDLALPLLIDALEKSKVKPGVDHPHTLTTMNNLALTYCAKSRQDLAVPMYRETLKGRTARLGADHPDTLWSMYNLARTYIELGQYAQAEPLLVGWFEKQKRRRTVDDLTIAFSQNALGECQLALKKFVEAEASLRASLSFFAQKYPTALMRHDTENQLGAALAGQKKFAEAEKLLVESARVFQKFGPGLTGGFRRRGAGALERVIAYYDARGNAVEADRWRTLRAEAFPPPAGKKEKP